MYTFLNNDSTTPIYFGHSDELTKYRNSLAETYGSSILQSSGGFNLAIAIFILKNSYKKLLIIKKCSQVHLFCFV